jgi:signal transduction histidine kinase
MDGVVEIAVRDYGRGIPAEQLARIFERFKQVEASDSKSRTGSGLGLAISRAIIEQMGGSIAVDSKVGAGSTFRITLPVV